MPASRSKSYTHADYNRNHVIERRRNMDDLTERSRPERQFVLKTNNEHSISGPQVRIKSTTSVVARLALINDARWRTTTPSRTTGSRL